MKKYNYIIIGCGIIGLSIARSLKNLNANATILILDKEEGEAHHASSRNSGVLHAGFYYTKDSLKAKFTVDGNRAMKNFCRENNLPINECGKLVIAQNEEELQTLFELEKRGKANGSNISIIDEAQAKEIEPNIKTFKKALHSPDTASVDPKIICATLKDKLEKAGVDFLFHTKYLSRVGNIIETSKGSYEADKIINCAGLYADKIAHDFGFGKKYTMLPFKGLYLKYTKNKTDVCTNIYPVPNLRNPFLGVHFTKTVDGTIKIGPTAIPAFWRENYSMSSNFRFDEMTNLLGHHIKLLATNSFDFRQLGLEEIKKYDKNYFISLAENMVQHIDRKGFTEFTKPGIRAQLLDKTNLKLVQDFVVEADAKSIHVLNAVSPAFTCAFPFADYVVQNFLSV